MIAEELRVAQCKFGVDWVYSKVCLDKQRSPPAGHANGVTGVNTNPHWLLFALTCGPQASLTVDWSE